MKTIILAMMFASSAFAGGPVPEVSCHQKTITVCPTKKPKKVVKRKPIVLTPQVIIIEVPAAPQTVSTPHVIRKTVVIVKEKLVCPTCSNPDVIIGVRAALGAGFRDPNGPEAVLGIRLHIPKLRLGVDLATSFAYGTGVALLVYPYQGEKLNWHINAGVLGTGSRLLSVIDVPRTWDLTLGSGLEYRVACNLSLTFDWRWAMPSPVSVAENGWPVMSNGAQLVGPDGRYLDVKQVIGNSLTQSHFMLGLMLRN